MSFVLLLPVCAVLGFAVCFLSQIFARENTGDKDNKIKYYGYILPLNKENAVMLAAVILMLVICAGVLDVVYSNSFLNSVKYISLLSILCVGAYTDWSKHIIPNSLILGAIGYRVVVFAMELIFDCQSALSQGLSGLAAGAIVFVIGFLCSLVLKGSVGMGDVKLLSVMTLFLGASGLICSFFVSLLVAFVYCIIAMIRKKKGRKDIIPFAPSLLMGTYVSFILFGFLRGGVL